MSAGHLAHSHPIDADRERELKTLLDDPQFAAAVKAYVLVDCDHDVPYAGGSETDWRTICWDRQLCAGIAAGKFRIAGKPEDPRPCGRVHEAVEGAIIHLWAHVCQLLGWDPKGPKYIRAHDVATLAEQQAVAHKGWDWNAYQDGWKPWVRIDERETITDPPANLLLEPYKGTPLYTKLAAFQAQSRSSSSKSGAGDQMARTKLSHAAVHYGLAKPKGDKCSSCEHFHGKDDCDLVEAPIYPGGWCDKFEAREAGEPVGETPAQESTERKPVPDRAQALAHGRAIAGAAALHAVGHITDDERDRHVAASQAAIAKAKPRKPFGSWAQ